MNDKVKEQLVDVCLNDDKTFRVLSQILKTDKHDVMLRSIGLTKLFVAEKYFGSKIYIVQKKKHWWSRAKKVEIMDI